MNTFKPDGWPTVTPRIFTDDVAGLVGFLKIVFGPTAGSNPKRRRRCGLAIRSS
jgi:hypothetical protein